MLNEYPQYYPQYDIDITKNYLLENVKTLHCCMFHGVLVQVHQNGIYFPDSKQHFTMDIMLCDNNSTILGVGNTSEIYLFKTLEQLHE